MSNVTNLILACSLGEKEELIISRLNNFKNGDRLFEIVSINDTKLPKAWYGGTKSMECHIFIGAYNYLDTNLLIDYIKTIEWEDAEDVQLIVREQDDERFRIINVFDV